MRSTLFSLFLVLCCVSFPCIGTSKVMWKYTLGCQWNTHSQIVWRSSECRHLLIHDLDQSWMSLAMHQLDRMEQEHDQQVSVLLWYLYALLCAVSRSLTHRHLQQPTFKLRSMLHYQLLHFASITSFTRLLGWKRQGWQMPRSAATWYMIYWLVLAFQFSRWLLVSALSHSLPTCYDAI